MVGTANPLATTIRWANPEEVIKRPIARKMLVFIRTTRALGRLKNDALLEAKGKLEGALVFRAATGSCWHASSFVQTGLS